MISKLILIMVFVVSSLFAETSMAECRQWVNGYVKKNGTVVKGYYRTCPDGNKNNNYGKPQYPGQNPRQRDQDRDGIPNHIDRDDNNNGFSDNTDHALGKIFREADPRRARVPRYTNHKRYEDYPLVREVLDSIIIYLPRTSMRTTTYKWSIWGNCIEYSRQGYEIGKVNKNFCREEVGSYFKWDIWGNCYEKSPEGYDIEKVEKNYCRAYVGRYFQWDIWGNCYEKTPEGYDIGKTNRNACRYSLGSKYEFDIWGNCYEKTPDGYDVQKMDDKNYCRYEGYGALDNNPAILHMTTELKAKRAQDKTNEEIEDSPQMFEVR
jgi:hypothetical protein